MSESGGLNPERILRLASMVLMVMTLRERSANVGDQNQAALAFPEPGSSEGSYGHPNLCSRPCVLFLRGTCEEGAGCGFCHSAHLQKPASFDKTQRKIVKSWSAVKLLEAILPHLRAKVKAIHHPGAGVLLELLQRELALRGPTNHSTGTAGVPSQIHRVLARMSVVALVGILASKLKGPVAVLLKEALIDLRKQVADP
ncbi:unnamed protein product [Durusdinium trenchii]|uniref:C3H1-type domain-containing protein n=1 Tax=Durusdinium trenchii TaxID=1381693 RepID=A0ABP0HCP0_9DINO